MYSIAVAAPKATHSIFRWVLAAGVAAAPVFADIVSELDGPGSAVAAGTYSAADSGALLQVLDAPARAPFPADPALDAAPEREAGELASLKSTPRTLDALTLDPQAKKFEAWDIKVGTIVPEPATALMLGAGLAAIAAARRQRGKSGQR